MKTVLVFALAASLAAPLAVSAATLKGSQFLPQAKVSLAQARASALKVAHGIIVDQELEKEQGGLRYSFGVKVGKTVREVGIDAITGKVLENTVDAGND